MKKVSLGLKEKSVPELIAFAFHVVSKMFENAFFPSPAPALKKVTDAAMELQKAFDKAQGAGPEQTAIMHQKRETMETLLTAEGHYVEDVANDPENKITGPEVIILSAGMSVKHFTPRQKQVFEVSMGDKPGTVVLVAERVERGTHEWEYSLDPSDASGWIEVDPTSKATVTITGLESGKRYFFRHRSVSSDGTSAWDGTIDMIVQ